MTFINANVLSNLVSLHCLSSLLNARLQNTMAEQNVPAQPPTRTDEQIVPRSQWLTIGKSNLLLNAQKIQKNPIFQISMEPSKQLPSSSKHSCISKCSAIYLQKKALAITPINPTHPFELPPSGDTVIDFVNELGYLEPVEIERLLEVTNPEPSLQCCGESSLKTNIDHAELIWEEFYSMGSRHFFSHKASTIQSEEPKEEMIMYRKSEVCPNGESVEVLDGNSRSPDN
ncbi:hypothetical protein Tco_0976981 [Tanacetum coccineum]|uniref:Uncharacterized protein n=1 Tax=Tanacetum coccineum TaxID=301880 RepID=A0ABQ5EIU5_9ASTR